MNITNAIKKPIDEKWLRWQRNVVDKYKDLPTEEIKQDLINNALPAAVLIGHVEGDFNIGNIIRTANSFRIIDIFYYGKKKIDARSMCGAGHYMNINHIQSLDKLKELKSKYIWVGLDNNIADTCSIKDFVWPDKPLICFGEENLGIEKEILDLMDFKVEIPTLGSVRSMNVASAAAIAAFDMCNKKGYL
jgi:tRNA G18 (ribose-2'-O)-methylase SpoU